MSFYIGHCYITLSPLFTGVITLMLLIDTTGMMSLFLLAMLIHEAGHLLFMRLFHCLPRQIQLLPFEVNMITDSLNGSVIQNIFISAGGVMANLLTAGMFHGDFRTVNLFLAVFNGLPIFSMDGYQIIQLLCDRHSVLEKIPMVLSAVTIALVGGLGLYLLVVAHNPLLLLFCLYMSVLAIRAKRHG